MAPPAWRGTLNTLFQLATISGIVIAGAVNIGTGERLGEEAELPRMAPLSCSKEKGLSTPKHVD